MNRHNISNPALQRRGFFLHYFSISFMRFATIGLAITALRSLFTISIGISGFSLNFLLSKRLIISLVVFSNTLLQSTIDSIVKGAYSVGAIFTSVSALLRLRLITFSICEVTQTKNKNCSFAGYLFMTTKQWASELLKLSSGK